MNICIADSHNDFLTNNNCNLYKLNNEIKRNNVVLCNAILFSKKEDKFSISKACKIKNKINNYLYLTKSCIYSFENLSFLTLNELDKLLEFCPFSCSLTWNYDNQFAGGAQEFGGLTNDGKKLIKLFNKNHIILDTAHLNRRSFWEAVKVTNLPIFNSHTCINLIEHRRNIDIEQTKAIIDTNGFIGITFVNEFLSNNSNISCTNVFKNVDYIIQKFGINNIGLGSDFYGTTNLHYNLNSYDNYKNLYTIFYNNGYKKTDINKIFYENFLNFVKTNSNLL